jgi:hypothetical protein
MASNLEFIEKRTASNVVNVTHTDLFSTKYNIYELYLDMQYNASSYFDINLLDSNGDVLTDSNYDVSIYEGIYTNTTGVYGMKFSASGGGSTTFDFLNVSVYGVKE